MSIRLNCTIWCKNTNTNYQECCKILHEVADEYLNKALDRLNKYLADGYTHLRSGTISKIKGSYSRSIVLKNISEIEHEIIPLKGMLHFSNAFEINSLKEWLKKKYQYAKNEIEEKYPIIVYRVAERKCKEMGLI